MDGQTNVEMVHKPFAHRRSPIKIDPQFRVGGSGDPLKPSVMQNL